LLTVAGAIDETNVQDEARFDGAMLESLGVTRLRTRTPWTDGEPEFEGVLGRNIMHAVGARGTIARALAINDYQASIPLTDFERLDVLVATRMNGEVLSRRNKGPLWIVYPWSQRPELDAPEIRSRAVWQLIRLTIE
jgi:hypothetical protein